MQTTRTPESRAHAPERSAPQPRLRTVAPPVDIFEDGERLHLLIDLPGVATDGVKLGVEKDVLTIEATFQAEFPGRSTYAELGPVAYYRAFALGDDLDTARITATMRNGVLELVLPKAERAKTKKIQVQVG
jgi:HSP20 family protein